MKDYNIRDGIIHKSLEFRNGAQIANAGGLNLAAILDAELAPALTEGNWTVGAGWESPIVGPGLIKNANGVGTQTPSAATTIIAGVTYKVVITLSARSVGSATYTLGGVTGQTLSAAATYTDYITASSTGKLIITPTNTSRFTISAISIKALTDATGDLTIDGNLVVRSPSYLYGEVATLLKVGTNVGFGITTGLLVAPNLTGGAGAYNRVCQIAPYQTVAASGNSISLYIIPTINSGVTQEKQFGLSVGGKQGAGVITSYVGLSTSVLGATNNTHLLLGTPAAVPPSGNYAIYDETSYPSHLSGSLDVTGFVGNTDEVDNGNSGAADTIVWAAGNCQKSTLADNCTFTFTAPNGVGMLTLKLIQDGTGSRAVTWPGTVIWSPLAAPVLQTAPAAVDIIEFYYDGTNYYGKYSVQPQYLWR